jgi:hypothetical protein
VTILLLRSIVREACVCGDLTGTFYHTVDGKAGFGGSAIQIRLIKAF